MCVELLDIIDQFDELERQAFLERKAHEYLNLLIRIRWFNTTSTHKWSLSEIDRFNKSIEEQMEMYNDNYLHDYIAEQRALGRFSEYPELPFKVVFK